MDNEREVLKAVKESEINPVLWVYEPGGELSGHFSIIIYKIGGKGLGYYDFVIIGEVMLLFPMSLLLLLSHTTGKSEEGGGG